MTGNAKEFWTVGIGRMNDWELRKCSVEDSQSYEIIEVYKGPIKDIKIEFNGDFAKDPKSDAFKLHTDTLPWVGFLLEDGRLYVKKPNQTIDELIAIDTDVTDFSMCRVWISQSFDVDLGFKIAYIKNQHGYLAEYRKTGADTYGWVTQEDLELEGVTHLQVLRLNDYRFGIYARFNNHTARLLISYRQYIGQALEITSINGTGKKEFMVFCTYNTEDPNPALIPKLSLDNPTTLRIHANYPFTYIQPNWNHFKVTSSNNQTISNVRIENEDILLDLSTPLDSPLSHLTLGTTGLPRIRYSVSPYMQPIIPDIVYELKSRPICVEDNVQSAVSVSNIQLQLIEKRQLKGTIDDSAYNNLYISKPTLNLCQVTIKNHKLTERSSNHITVGNVQFSEILNSTQPI